MLRREAWNALLKILEEPRPRVVFVFATTEPHKIAQTAAPVLSRLQRFDFRRIGPHAIAERLQAVVRAEQIAAEEDALHLIAKSADGGMRDALSVLDQVLSFGEGPVTADRVRAVLGLIPDELYGEMLRLVSERDAAAVFPLVERLLEAGAGLGEVGGRGGRDAARVARRGIGRPARRAHRGPGAGGAERGGPAATPRRDAAARRAGRDGGADPPRRQHAARRRAAAAAVGDDGSDGRTRRGDSGAGDRAGGARRGERDSPARGPATAASAARHRAPLAAARSRVIPEGPSLLGAPPEALAPHRCRPPARQPDDRHPAV